MSFYVLFFFNDTATTEIYTLSLHDALPICPVHDERAALAFLAEAQVLERLDHGDGERVVDGGVVDVAGRYARLRERLRARPRSEEHTSELQSRQYLVCRLLLEKKKNKS